MKSVNKNSINAQITDFRKQLSQELNLNVSMVRQSIIFCEHLQALVDSHNGDFSLKFNDLHISKLSCRCFAMVQEDDARIQQAAQGMLDFLEKAHNVSLAQMMQKSFSASCQVSHLNVTALCHLLRCNTRF